MAPVDADARPWHTLAIPASRNRYAGMHPPSDPAYVGRDDALLDVNLNIDAPARQASSGPKRPQCPRKRPRNTFEKKNPEVAKLFGVFTLTDTSVPTMRSDTTQKRSDAGLGGKGKVAQEIVPNPIAGVFEWQVELGLANLIPGPCVAPVPLPEAPAPSVSRNKGKGRAVDVGKTARHAHDVSSAPTQRLDSKARAAEIFAQIRSKKAFHERRLRENYGEAEGARRSQAIAILREAQLEQERCDANPAYAAWFVTQSQGL
ncbi:hypothetical protein MKEN_01032500 [Mycena kentingensis (nom. inval.)]|nr:hypothetical protein MKEN_01032500 [Mycena kentingensis (nom. inval.)]